MARITNVYVVMAKAGEDAYRIALFNKFCDSTSFVEILRLFEELCGVCSVDHHQYHGLVQGLKPKLSSWKCLDIFKIFETKANHPVYKKQKCCEGMRCLVIGAGPVGLRSAIEAALLGAKVDVVEKRDDFSRNNVLHLWPFLLTDLRNLGTKKFYGKFCSGDLDHISKCPTCVTARGENERLCVCMYVTFQNYIRPCHCVHFPYISMYNGIIYRRATMLPFTVMTVVKGVVNNGRFDSIKKCDCRPFMY